MTQALLFTAIFPVLVAGGVLLLPLVLSKALGWKVRGASFAAVGLALAYLVGHPGVRGEVPTLPPGDVTDWPWVFAPLAAVLGLLGTRWGHVVPLRWSLLWGLQSLGLYLVARPALASAADPDYGEPGGWLVLFFACALALLYALGLDRTSRAEAEPPTLLALVVFVSLSSGVIVLGRTASVGQLCGVLAAGLFPLLVLAWRQPALTPLRGAIPVLAVLHPLLVANGYYYAELPASSAGLLALTPWAIVLTRSGPLRRWPSWRSLILALVGVAALCGAAAALANGGAPEPYSPY